jgi:hypothetical protein
VPHTATCVQPVAGAHFGLALFLTLALPPLLGRDRFRVSHRLRLATQASVSALVACRSWAGTF